MRKVKRNKIGRNELCPCGSSIKFKRCCLTSLNKIHADKDILVIVGAGASLAHSQEITSCPPLGKDLASTLRKALPEFEQLEADVGKMCGSDFEEWMENYTRMDSRVYSGVLWCLSKYFSGYNVIPNDSLYLELLDRIGPALLKKTAFISLNYESLLELAIQRMGYYVDPVAHIDQDSFNTKETQIRIPVLKPHGSSNYRVLDSSPNFGTTFSGKVTIGPNQKGIVFENINLNKVETAVTGECIIKGTKFENPRDVHGMLDGLSTSNHSIICAYNPEKTSNFNHDLINDIREHSFNLLNNCKKLVMIGIGHRKEDVIINKIVEVGLRAAGSNVRFIGGTNCCKGYFGTTDEYFLDTTFRGGLDGVSEFLNS